MQEMNVDIVVKNKLYELSEKNYKDIESKFKKFSDKTKIPMDHLDLLFWARETGKVFK